MAAIPVPKKLSNRPTPLALDDTLTAVEADLHRPDGCSGEEWCLMYAAAYNWRAWSCAWCTHRKERRVTLAVGEQGLAAIRGLWMFSKIPVLCAATKKMVAGPPEMANGISSQRVEVAVVGPAVCQACKQMSLFGAESLVYRNGCENGHRWAANGGELLVFDKGWMRWTK